MTPEEALRILADPKNWILPKATPIGPWPKLPIWKPHTSGFENPQALAAAALESIR